MLPKVLVIAALACSAVVGDAPSAQYLPPNGAGGGGNGYGGNNLGGVGGGSGYGGSGSGGGGSGFGGTGGGGSGPGEEGGKPEPFSFSYEVKDAESGNDYSHKAESDGNTVRGEYKVLLPDGRRQTVTYTADSQGYNADVQYDGEASTGAGGAGGAGSAGGAGGYPSGRPSGASGFGSTGGGAGGYPSGGPGGFPSGNGGAGRPTGAGGYPSAGGNGGGNGYPSGRPNSNYLPPGK